MPCQHFFKSGHGWFEIFKGSSTNHQWDLFPFFLSFCVIGIMLFFLNSIRIRSWSLILGWAVVHWAIRLEQFRNEPLLSLRIPSHVLTELIIVPYMNSTYAWSPVVFTGVLLHVFVPSFCILLHLLDAWQLEFAIKKLCYPPAPHLRCVQIWNTLWESNHR